jgi:hypothetical protein
MNVASQCRATASADLCKNILVDGGSGFLFELLLDAAKAIETLEQERALQALHSENERLGLYKDAYAEPDLIARLRDTASKGVSVWGDLMLEAAKELEILMAERECYASAMDRMLAQPEQEPVAWPCLIDSADFSKGTVTVVMQCEDYKVSAGTHWLSTTPPKETT